MPLAHEAVVKAVGDMVPPSYQVGCHRERRNAFNWPKCLESGRSYSLIGFNFVYEDRDGEFLYFAGFGNGADCGTS
jgi:hypothetical protein